MAARTSLKTPTLFCLGITTIHFPPPSRVRVRVRVRDRLRFRGKGRVRGRVNDQPGSLGFFF